MAIGISLYLLMYMWIKAMSGYTSYSHYDYRRSDRAKVRYTPTTDQMIISYSLTA